MKKILIASPVRGGVSPSYVRALISMLFANWKGQFQFQWAATSGTSVAMARDELANVCLTGGYDEMIFWDVDCCAFEASHNLAMFARLLSHDVDIVAGQYVGHNFHSHFHGAADGKEPRADGLMEMGQIPLGFSKITRRALEQIKAKHPHLLYALKQTQDDKAKPNMFEFFPNGIVGPCSSQGKLDRIGEVLKNYGKHAANFSEYLEAIHGILHDARYETNYLLGEDFYFCKLAREAGLTLYIDNNMIVPHESKVRLPVPNSELLRSLSEPWRWGDNIMESEVHHLIEGLRVKFARDHL